MYGETDQFGNKQLSICSYEPCNSYFLPKKRFAQKYCCESCRVMAYRDRKLGGKVNLAGVYKKATNEDVIQRINRLENNALIGGGIIVLLQVIQLVQSGQIKSITKEQREVLNDFKEEAKKNKDLNALFSSLTL
jgi:hypothetical protein